MSSDHHLPPKFRRSAAPRVEREVNLCAALDMLTPALKRLHEAQIDTSQRVVQLPDTATTAEFRAAWVADLIALQNFLEDLDTRITEVVEAAVALLNL